jgi:hypothetical protein
MPWYLYIAYFLGGALCVNAIPHFINGVSGRPFPSPFASPPGRGMSSPIINVLWGMFNLFVGYLLIFRGEPPFFPGNRAALLVGVGGLVMAIQLASWFGRAGRDQ